MTQSTPPHPIVIDKATRLCRLATQDDVHVMEAICTAYMAMIEAARQQVARSEYLAQQLDHTYRGE